MKRKAEGIALLSVYNDEDEEEEEEDEEAGTSIVDYGHDDAAEATGTNDPERSACLTGEEASASEAVPPDAQATTVESSPPPPPDEQVLQQQDVDEGMLADFLPLPPTCKCSDELQDKFTWFLSLKEAGRSFNEELRNSKGYRNPDFLHRAVIHQGVDQLGSCFNKEIFDPHGYNPEDFYDALEEQRRESDRRDMERQQNQKLEFVRGSTLAAAKMMQQKMNVSAAQNETAAAKSEGRNKKSKWDKVEPGAQLNPQNALAAALVSANAAAFNIAQAAQQAQAIQAAQQQLQQHKQKDEERLPRNKKSERA